MARHEQFPSLPCKNKSQKGALSAVVANTLGWNGASNGLINKCMPTPNPIRNCPVQFREPCPKTWESLQPTGNPTVRHCEACQKPVHLCTTDAAIMEHARKGDCVAWPQADLGNFPDDCFTLGRPEKPVPRPTPQQMALLRAWQLDAAKTRELDKLKYSSRFCPECGFPCPNWYDACRVCGFKIGKIRSDE